MLTFIIHVFTLMFIITVKVIEKFLYINHINTNIVTAIFDFQVPVYQPNWMSTKLFERYISMHISLHKQVFDENTAGVWMDNIVVCCISSAILKNGEAAVNLNLTNEYIPKIMQAVCCIFCFVVINSWPILLISFRITLLVTVDFSRGWDSCGPFY